MSQSSLPDRQLRKLPANEPINDKGSLPDRQLRKFQCEKEPAQIRSLPDRQLRKTAGQVGNFMRVHCRIGSLEIETKTIDVHP